MTLDDLQQAEAQLLRDRARDMDRAGWPERAEEIRDEARRQKEQEATI